MDYVTNFLLERTSPLRQLHMSYISLPLFTMSNIAEENLCASTESLEINHTEKLDNLLECYLDLLDQYTTFRRQLSQHLSAVRFLPPSPVTTISDV